MNSLIFPFAIQCDTIANRFSDIITPTSGRMFGCRRDFHITASLQNFCAKYCQRGARRNEVAPVTHVEDLLRCVSQKSLDDLYSDLSTAVFPLPHLCIPTPIGRVFGWIVVYLNHEGSRNNCMLAACPVQQPERFLSGRLRNFGRIQCLLDR